MAQIASAFESIFYSSPIPSCVIQDNHFSLINRKLAVAMGYTEQELLEIPFDELIYPDDRSRVLENELGRLAGKKTPDSYEFRILTPGGKLVCISGYFALIDYNESPAILVQFVKVNKQRSNDKGLLESEKRRRLPVDTRPDTLGERDENGFSKHLQLKWEDAFVESRKDLRCLSDTIDDFLFMLDPGGLIFYSNLFSQERLGYSAGELTGLKLFDLLPTENKEEVKQIIKSIKAGKAKSFSITLVAKSGRFIPVETKLMMIRWDNREVLFCVSRDITERMQAEEALTTERQKFQTLTEEAPFGMAMFDKDGNFKYINHRFKEIFGYDLSDIPNRAEWFRLAYHDPEYRHMVLAAWNRVLKSTRPGKRKSSVFNVTCKDGKEKIIRFKPVKFLAGECMMTYEDITLGKQVEEELLRIKKAVESSGNAIWMTDKKGKRIIYLNESFTKLMGYSAEEFNAAGGAPIVYQDTETARKVYDTVMNGCSWKGEIELRTRSSENIPVYFNCDSVRNEEGEIIAIFGIFNDITERRLAEQKMQTANQQLLDTINFLPDATFVVDQKGKVIAWNKAIEEMTGVRREDILGKGDYAYAVPFYGKARPILIDMIVAGDLESEQRYEYLTRKENTIYGESCVPFLFGKKDAYLWGKASPLFDREGTLTGAIESIRDITERKQIEEQLKYLSLHDSHTGLYNRTFFEDGMRRAEDGRFDPVSIIVCDLDGLKFVNDTLGHATGDTVLAASANVISSAFRKSDIVARIGGDEFAILLSQSDERIAEKACDRIRQAIDRYNAAGPEIPLSISIGFAVKSDTSESMSNLFKEADDSMYRDKLHRGQSARSAIVQTLLKTLEARDLITEGHAVRLQDYVTVLAEAVGMPGRDIAELCLLAKFHDIGKVGVSDKILFKPGPLNLDEVDEMRRHSEIGFRIAKSAPDLAPVADWILKHHEWWNGKGYPLGLKGEEIPLECRILAIADAYDAMTSDRPYRKAMTHDSAVGELKRFAGVQFDPDLVFHFLEQLEKHSERYIS